jgi:hypothetical protein
MAMCDDLASFGFPESLVTDVLEAVGGEVRRHSHRDYTVATATAQRVCGRRHIINSHGPLREGI